MATSIIKVTTLSSPSPTSICGGGGSSRSSQWVRKLATITSGGRVMAMSKGSASIDSKKTEKISVWWRFISCAYFGGAQEKGLGSSRNWIWGSSSTSSASSLSSSSSHGQKAFFSQSNKGGGIVADNMGSQDDRDDALRSPSSSYEDELNHHHHQHRLLTLPTILTLGRVAAVPILVTTFYMNSWWAATATTSIFVVAAITDWLDGYIARKMRLGTAFGAFLDPVADKLMVAATLVLMCTRPLEFAAFREISWLLPVPSIAIIGREITMSAVREWAASQNGKVLEAVAVNNLGKWKTASQMIALTLLLASRDSSFIGPEILVPSGVGLLYVSAGLAVYSLAVYMKNIWRILIKL